MNGSVRVILWRHGLTGWNSEGRIQGQLDPPLSDVGVAEADKAAALLATLRPSALVSSDLRRARETAAALANRTDLAVRTDERLRERSWGEWEGLTHAEIAERDPEGFAALRSGYGGPLAGREEPEQVRERVSAAVRKAVARVSDGENPLVVVVSHGGAIRYAVAELLGWPEGLARTVGGMDNCHWTELRARGRAGGNDPDEWLLWSYNVGAGSP